MMVEPERRRAMIGGVWLIGFGVLFATRSWWPGIMFLVALTAFIEGWSRDQLWSGIQSAFWLAFIGCWALTRFSLAFLFVGLGISTIVGALVKPNPFSKPKPFVDSSLE